MLTHGWIKLHRSIQESEVFDDGEPYTRRDAWIWILMNANIKDNVTYHGFNQIEIKRGQLITSIRSLSVAWNRSLAWCMKTVDLFCANEMLEKARTPGGTLLTVVNYGFYQDMDTEVRTPRETTCERSVEQTANAPWNISKKDKKEYKKAKKEKEDIDCTEPSQASAPPVLQFILNDKTYYPITQADIDHFKELYPGVDIMQELRKICGWCEGNPTKRKTKSGALKFVHSWLAREQNRGNPYRPEIKRTVNPYLDMLKEEGETT